MGVASGCGEQEVGVASGNGWNLWVWLLGVVLKRYIDFLILLIPTPLVSVLFCSSIPTSFFILLNVITIDQPKKFLQQCNRTIENPGYGPALRLCTYTQDRLWQYWS